MPVNSWKKKPTPVQLAKLLNDEAQIAGVNTAQYLKLNDPDADRERRELAASIAIGRYGEKPIDKRIDETLDEPGERQITARWLNDDIAIWVSEVSQYGWRWTACQPDELSKVNWKSEFTYFVYSHLK